MNSKKRRIRPAARLLETIGRDLIKDVYAAIVELVKNSYDADSPKAKISIRYDEIKKSLYISIEDNGHGMDYDTVINKWLVPATDDKLLRKRSSKGRVLQGRKGIGRFAAAVLGERVSMTTTRNGVTTSLMLDMNELSKVSFLDELEIELDTKNTADSNGTIILIEKENLSKEDVKNIWTSKQIRKLLVELRGLTAPDEVYQLAESQGFDIYHDSFEMELVFGDFPIDDYNNRKISITPFPVLELYDYRISGKIDAQGTANLYYGNQNISALPEEEIKIKVPIDIKNGQCYPGDIFIDIRVYDRDSDSIENIIKRGLKDPVTNEYVGKQEARRILDEYYGVGIYREQFKIRPYGEQSFDWLDLDKKRVQNPSLKIGHNQIVGFVYVRPEEVSGLQEKSARDGLMENGSYFGLISVVSQAIRELEVRRQNYRENAQKGGRGRTIEDQIDLLFDFNNTKQKISKEIGLLDITSTQRAQIESAVDKVLDFEKQKKLDFARKIRETIAIYQGQATLGKITHVLLHEGRKHIKYISETVPRVNKWAIQLASNTESELQERLADRCKKIISHTKGLEFLFKKIEPLSRTRRAPKKLLYIEKEIQSIFSIFSSEIDSENITYEMLFNQSDISVQANEMDFITIFSNLIENSVFWLSYNKNKEKNIKISAFKEGDNVIVVYQDNGPGFHGGSLELMFDPGYSMKPDGTGLGLALAGEAMSRIGGKIEAKSSDDGAVFELIFEGKQG